MKSTDIEPFEGRTRPTDDPPKKAAPRRESNGAENKPNQINKPAFSGEVKPLPLPIRLRIGGFECEQLKRSGNLAIYRKRLRSSDEWSYEVVRILVRPEEFQSGKHYPKREVYPSSEDWGTHGFSPFTLDDAFEKLQEMLPEGSHSDTGDVCNADETQQPWGKPKCLPDNHGDLQHPAWRAL